MNIEVRGKNKTNNLNYYKYR